MSWDGSEKSDRYVVGYDGKSVYVPSDGRVATDNNGKTIVVDQKGNKIG